MKLIEQDASKNVHPYSINPAKINTKLADIHTKHLMNNSLVGIKNILNYEFESRRLRHFWIQVRFGSLSKTVYW